MDVNEEILAGNCEIVHLCKRCNLKTIGIGDSARPSDAPEGAVLRQCEGCREIYTLSNLDLLEGLAKAATKGPWNAEWTNDVGPNDEGYWEYYQAGPAQVHFTNIRGEKRQAGTDAALIAGLRNAATELIAQARELERLKQELTAGPKCQCGREIHIPSECHVCSNDE